MVQTTGALSREKASLEKCKVKRKLLADYHMWLLLMHAIRPMIYTALMAAKSRFTVSLKPIARLWAEKRVDHRLHLP